MSSQILLCLFHPCIAQLFPLSVRPPSTYGRPHTDIQAGFLKWISLLYRNQGSLFFKPRPLDWSEQIVVVTGGATLIGFYWHFHDSRRV